MRADPRLTAPLGRWWPRRWAQVRRRLSGLLTLAIVLQSLLPLLGLLTLVG